MARKFSIADICFYPTLFENKNKGTMPLAQFYFHSLEAQDSAFYTPRSLAGVIRNWSKISKLLIMSQKEVYILLTGNISMIYESKYKKFHIFHMQQAVGKWKPKINSEWVFFSRPFPNCSSCVYNCDLTQENIHYSNLLTGKTDYWEAGGRRISKMLNGYRKH